MSLLHPFSSISPHQPTLLQYYIQYFISSPPSCTPSPYKRLYSIPPIPHHLTGRRSPQEEGSQLWLNIGKTCSPPLRVVGDIWTVSNLSPPSSKSLSQGPYNILHHLSISFYLFLTLSSLSISLPQSISSPLSISLPLYISLLSIYLSPSIYISPLYLSLSPLYILYISLPSIYISPSLSFSLPSISVSFKLIL